MGRPALKAPTYQDILDLPEHLTGEIVAGELFASPRPSFDHSGVSSALTSDLGPPFMRGRGGPGGWWIFFEPELHMGGDIMVPDLAGWRRERMPQRHRGAYHTLAPDWICEIHSPSTARLDRIRKMPAYAREGVNHAWLIDPAARLLEVFRLTDGLWTVVGAYGGDALVRAEPFDAIELDLLALWGEERVPDAEASASEE